MNNFTHETPETPLHVVSFMHGVRYAMSRLLPQAEAARRYQEGYTEGYDAGRADGYADGYDAGRADLETELACLDDDDDDTIIYTLTDAGRAAIRAQDAQDGGAA